MNLDITKSRYSEHILPVPRPIVISMFHYILFLDLRSLRNKRFRASSSRKLGRKKKNFALAKTL